MKYYRYNIGPTKEDPNPGTELVSEEEILKRYFEYWSNEMKKAGKESEISKELCIQDFVSCNWAWEEKQMDIKLLNQVLEIAEEISKSVPAFDDERMDYVEIQISKEDLEILKKAFKK